MKFLVDEKVLNGILEYLSKKQWLEANPLITLIQNNAVPFEEPVEPVEETAPSTEEMEQ